MSYSELHILKKSWIVVTESGNKCFQQEQFSLSKSWFNASFMPVNLLFIIVSDRKNQKTTKF